jgi:hypothetical protein
MFLEPFLLLTDNLTNSLILYSTLKENPSLVVGCMGESFHETPTCVRLSSKHLCESQMKKERSSCQHLRPWGYSRCAESLHVLLICYGTERAHTGQIMIKWLLSIEGVPAVFPQQIHSPYPLQSLQECHTVSDIKGLCGTGR